MMTQPHSDDQELLRRLEQGDEQAFTAIYKRYWKPMYFLAYKRVQQEEETREIVQEVFYTIWDKRSSLKIDNLSVYLAAMTRYAVYRSLSREKKKKEYMQLERLKERSAIPIDIENKQLLDLLKNFTEKLPEKYRIVFLHHKLLDESIESVADKLGVSPRTAEGYVARVMSLIRSYYQKVTVLMVILLSEVFLKK
jgi:RNA polymerase sigma factor (sigma-70 family)